MPFNKVHAKMPSTLNEADRMQKWSNKRANEITDKAYSFENAEMFANHLEGELFNVCYDLDIANNSNAYLEGTMRTMQKELADLREFKETTEKALDHNPSFASVFNYMIQEIKRTENAAKKAAKKAAVEKAPPKKSPKQVHPSAIAAVTGRRACTKNSKYKGFYSGMS